MSTEPRSNAADTPERERWLPPDFFIVGAAKAGTTAFHRLLSEHPGLFLPEHKEPHFYALANTTAPLLRPDGKPAMIMDSVIHDQGAYRALFAERGQRVAGEASISYLYLPGTAQTLRRECPDAKIIAILRDPVERAFSSYLHLRRELLEPLTFERALAAESERIAGNVGLLWRYVDAGRYARQLDPYLAAFPRERIHIVIYDDYRADPRGTLREVFRFLGVDDRFEPDTDARVNVGGEPRSGAVHRLLKLPHALPGAVKALPGAGRVRAWIGSARSSNLTRPELPKAAREVLIETFAPDIPALEALLGRRLPGWARP